MGPGARPSRVLLTGASSGIGRGVALRLAQDGVALVLTGRSRERLDAVAKEAAELGSATTPLSLVADLATEDGLRSLLEGIEGPLDGVVHAAGEAIRDQPLRDVEPAALDEALALPLFAPLQLLRALHPLLRESAASVVLISSNLDRRPLPGLGAYSVAKAAESQLARALALEWGPDGIRVNAVCPGLVRTPASESQPNFTELEKAAVARTPLGRIAEVADVASVVHFLLGEGARQVTGQCWVVDGGASLPA